MEHLIALSEQQLIQVRRLDCPCQGSGNLVTFKNGKPTWWACPGCGHARQIAAFNPAEIRIHSLRNVGNGITAFRISDFPENALMAHVMAKAGIFSSVNQARKNGWDKPIELGRWAVGKQKTQIEVTS